MLSPNDKPVILLPEDWALIKALGITEAEYRAFVRECAKQSKIRPGEPTMFFNIGAFFVNLIIGLVLQTIASLIFRPKTSNPAEIRQTSVQGQNSVNRSEFAPKAGFDSFQNVVELGSSIPLVFAGRETINGVTYGGVRVNTNMLWSQMMSQGGGQMLRAIFLVSEGPIVEIDETQFAFGDNLLGGYDLREANQFGSRVSFYFNNDGGRLTSSSHIAGRSAALDPGNSENISLPGNLPGSPNNPPGSDVFQVLDLNYSWDSYSCYTLKPSTQTQFGLHSLIGNGLGFRVNPSLRPAVVVKTEPSGNSDTRLTCETDGVAAAQRLKYDTVFSSRSGIVHHGVVTNGILPPSNYSGPINLPPVHTVVNVGVGDIIRYCLDSASDAGRVFVGVQEGPDHEETCRDVAQTVSGRQRGWDDALSVGELYKLGSAVMVCESRTPDGEIFVSEADQEPTGGGQTIFVEMRCVKAGQAMFNVSSAVYNSQTNSYTFTFEAKSSTSTSHLFKLATASFVIPRRAQIIEIGLRSTLGIRISGLCNFQDCLSEDVIDGRACSYYNGRVYAPGQSLELSNYQSGSFSGAEERYSFFKIGYRIAGQDVPFTFLEQCFGVRSLTQQSVYNFIRLEMPSSQRWEFYIEPVSGWEIRGNVATGTLEILDARIQGYRTTSSPSTGGNIPQRVGIVFSGEPVARVADTFRIAATRDRGLGVSTLEQDDYADSWGRLAEEFVFEEIKTSATTPEHEVVYVNIVTRNDYQPEYSNMAIVGMNLRSSTEFSQLAQLSVYVNRGIDGVHSFPEVLQRILTNTRWGVGSILSPSQIDADSFSECAAWTRERRYFFDGAISEAINVRQWASQTANFFLLELLIKNGKFALQPAFYFDRPEPITNLYTAGNIIEDSFELAYTDVEQRIPVRVSVKWRQESNVPSGLVDSSSGKGLFPVIREITVRERGTASNAPLESIDLSDFCTSETHAIDVAKFLCLGRRLITHSVRFKTIPAQASLQVGRCFKLGLETTIYDQPRNGAIDANGNITANVPLPDGIYQVLIWLGRASDTIQQVSLEVVNQRSEVFRNAVFCVKEASVETRAYKVQSLSFDEDGNIDVEATYFPLNENGYSLFAVNWDDGNYEGRWIIEGLSGSEAITTNRSFAIYGADLLAPTTISPGQSYTCSMAVSAFENFSSYSWSVVAAGTGFPPNNITITGQGPAATLTYASGNSGQSLAIVSCTASSFSNIITASSDPIAIVNLSPSEIGAASISGSATVALNTPIQYTVTYLNKPPAIPAQQIQSGKVYQIVTSGTYNWVFIGSPNNTVGTVFRATKNGTEVNDITGTADIVNSPAAVISWSWVRVFSSQGSASIINSNAPRATVTFAQAGVYELRCLLSLSGATDSPRTAIFNVTAA